MEWWGLVLADKLWKFKQIESCRCGAERGSSSVTRSKTFPRMPSPQQLRVWETWWYGAGDRCRHHHISISAVTLYTVYTGWHRHIARSVTRSLGRRNENKQLQLSTFPLQWRSWRTNWTLHRLNQGQWRTNIWTSQLYIGIWWICCTEANCKTWQNSHSQT